MLVPDQGKDAISRGDKLICWWWSRLMQRCRWNDHKLAKVTSTQTNTSGRLDGTRIVFGYRIPENIGMAPVEAGTATRAVSPQEAKVVA